MVSAPLKRAVRHRIGRAGQAGVANEERGEQSMKDQNYSISFTTDQPAKKVFDAINNVRGWWSGEIEGTTDKLGAEFTYRYEDVHRSGKKITELITGKKIVWRVLENYLNFTKDKSEWTGTEIVFEISK